MFWADSLVIHKPVPDRELWDNRAGRDLLGTEKSKYACLLRIFPGEGQRYYV